MRPYGLQQAAHALGSLSKVGVHIPPSTVIRLARQAAALAPFWDLAGSAAIMGSVHRLMRPTLWTSSPDGRSEDEAEAAVRQMGSSVLEAQAGRMVAKQRETGSWTMVS